MNKKISFALLLLIGCYNQIASDIFAPAIPQVAQFMGSSIGELQLTMAFYMLAVALSLLVFGPLADSFGRKPTLITGLLITLLGTLIAIQATQASSLIFARIIQGIGAAACAGLWRSIFRDLFKGEALAKYGSYFAIFIMFMVPVAPVIGAYLNQLFSWNAIFFLMAGYALVTLLLIILFYKETLPQEHRQTFAIKSVLKNYLLLAKNSQYAGITLCCFLSYGAFFIWFTVGPSLLITQHHWTPAQFAWFSFLVGSISYAIGGWFNGKYVSAIGMPNMLRLGWSIMIIGGLTIIAFHSSVNFTLAGVVALFLGSTLIWPNAFATAMTPFGHMAGIAGTTYSFMQIAGAAFFSTLLAHIAPNGSLALGLAITLAGITAFLSYEFIVKKPL